MCKLMNGEKYMNNAQTKDHESLVQAHEARIAALLAGDLPALALVVGEDMTFVSATGQVQTRADVIASFEAGTLSIIRMDCRDVSTRIYGDVGVLLYVADGQTRHGGEMFEGVTRSTTVYARRAGGWQMVAQHQSRVEA
jgi:ketosteroid isomerase-like protein